MFFELVGISLAAVLVLAVALILRKPKKASQAQHSTAASPVAKRRSAALPSLQTDDSVVAFDEAAVVATPLVPEALQRLSLATTRDMDEATAARVQSICANMPEPHPVQRQLASGLDEPEALMEVVASDAGLTAGILRTVNSAAFALSAPITSVQHAITYLGVSTVRRLVAQAALAERAEEGTAEQQAALARIWKSAGVASALAQMLGLELGLSRPSVLATKALFFNLGDVALVLGVEGAAAWYDEAVTPVERITQQQAACGANTAVVGSQLARAWNLPEDIIQAIEAGLLPLTSPAPAQAMELEDQHACALMYLAGRIGDRAAFHGLKDIGELKILDSDAPELFYLPVYLEAAGLPRAADILLDSAFRRKANRLLATLGA